MYTAATIATITIVTVTTTPSGNTNSLQCDISIRHGEGVVVVAEIGNTVIVHVPSVEDQIIFVRNRIKQNIDQLTSGVAITISRDSGEAVVRFIGHMESFLAASVAVIFASVAATYATIIAAIFTGIAAITIGSAILGVGRSDREKHQQTDEQ